MEDDFFLFLIGGQVVMTLLAWMIGASRGRGAAGFLCGFLLGPLGVIIALFLPKGEEEKSRKPGAPVSRQRRMPVMQDPIEEFEARERARRAFEETPTHLRGRRVDDK
jgi:hypothetical protein